MVTSTILFLIFWYFFEHLYLINPSKAYFLKGGIFKILWQKNDFNLAYLVITIVHWRFFEKNNLQELCMNDIQLYLINKANFLGLIQWQVRGVFQKSMGSAEPTEPTLTTPLQAFENYQSPFHVVNWSYDNNLPVFIWYQNITKTTNFICLLRKSYLISDFIISISKKLNLQLCQLRIIKTLFM